MAAPPIRFILFRRMQESPTSNKLSNSTKTVLQWVAIVVFFLFLRFTDQGTVVLSWMQRAVLATGIMQPDMVYAEKNQVQADFNLKLTTLEGEPVELASFRGKAIFMNFWATWCAPCLAEFPYIESLYEDMKDENIAFVMIGTDESEEVMREFIRVKGYKAPMYRLAGRVPEMYNVRTLPTTFVISPNGDMATVHVGMANYDTRGFRSFLKNTAASALD